MDDAPRCEESGTGSQKLLVCMSWGSSLDLVLQQYWLSSWGLRSETFILVSSDEFRMYGVLCSETKRFKGTDLADLLKRHFPELFSLCLGTGVRQWFVPTCSFVKHEEGQDSVRRSL